MKSKAAATPDETGTVNDIHSQLNETRVAAIRRPRSFEDVRRIVREARDSGLPIGICGGRHAMGGQQFASGAILIDMRDLNWIGALDCRLGMLEVGAGIQWPALLDTLHTMQPGSDQAWTFAQKQTGADRLTIGGALAANVHGRGLTMRPIIQDVESFLLVNADAELRRCSRTENQELFRLAIGGYGLFGVIVSVTLRLVRRQKLERVVRVLDMPDLMAAFESRIADGFLYGDFQFAIDTDSPEFLRRGIFSCYKPVDHGREIPGGQRSLSEDSWRDLLTLAHVDKAECWERYSRHYLATEGQLYWSDKHQMSTYMDDYHRDMEGRIDACRGSEMITEIYVPRERLADFMGVAADLLRAGDANCVYGTIRLIERDDESFLSWATADWACIIFNLHADHDSASLARSADLFRALIDLALERGGSYYLTYHRYAMREQLLAAYPQFPEFLKLKLAYDPEERFQSEWYRHYKAWFGEDAVAPGMMAGDAS
ncbi:MAG: FAD-binding oxidoreductase [Gemmatimonadaceae bacterium]